MKQKADLKILAAIAIAVFLWSAVEPHDYFTWWLEVAPVIVGLIILAFTREAFPLTHLTYWLIGIHAIILLIGGHYSYAHVPLFDDFKSHFGWTRNNYDKVGHFAQGFVPAIIAREILLRKTALTHGKMLFFLVTCICLAISAAYELIEWLTSATLGAAADEFLGSQGDVWDTQKDMAWALAGAISAQAILSKRHDRQLARFVR